MSDAMRPFDRRLVRLHRERAAASLARHDFLIREAAERLLDRLDDTKRRFATALDLGCHGGEIARLLRGRGGIARLIQADLSPAMARRAGGLALAADEEALPFARHSLDLVLSNLSLHWVNDLPGALIQIREALKPDGMLLAAMLGGESLRELRSVLLDAELEVEGGASPRLSPLVDLRDAAALLQRTGFALPLVDRDEIAVTYPDALALMRDLRGMGESNAVEARRHNFTRRATLLRAAELYAERFAAPDGRINATFQIVYLTGWAPHAAQPKALKPGSARTRLATALGTEEHPAGDKIRPPGGG